MKRLACLSVLAAACLAFGAGGVKYRTVETSLKGRYEAKCTYPVFAGKSPVVKLANAEIKKWVRDQHEGFVRQAKEYFGNAKTKPPAGGSDLAWTQTVTSEAVFHNPKAVSVRVRVDTFLGGAHPAYEDTVFNYALVGGKPKRLTFSDLFSDPSSAKKRAEALLFKKLRATGKAEWIDNGMVTGIEPKQLNRFVIGREGLTFLFNPYEMGPWVVGNFEIPLSFKELGPGFKKGLLGL